MAFKMGVLFPAQMINDRILAAESEAKLAMMQAKTTIDHVEATSRNRKQRQRRLESQEVIAAHRKAAQRISHFNELHRAVTLGK